MEPEYEYLTADTPENFKTIAEWFFAPGGCEVANSKDSFSWTEALAISRNFVYRRKKQQQDVLLTDIYEIARGIVAGVVDVLSPSDGKWYNAHSANDVVIRCSIQSGHKYRLKPGRTLPPKLTDDILLTDPDEIKKALDAGVLEVRTPKGIIFYAAEGFNDPKDFAKKPLHYIGLEWAFRIKPVCALPPKKKTVKKLVDRTPEDFLPLIGRWWCKNKKDGFISLIISVKMYDAQSNWEIAPLGTEEWQPMRKTVMVEE